MQVTHDSLSMLIYKEEEDGTADATTASIVHIAVDNIVRMEMVSKTLLCYLCLQKLSPKLLVWCDLTTNGSIFDADIFIVPPKSEDVLSGKIFFEHDLFCSVFPYAVSAVRAHKRST